MFKLGDKVISVLNNQDTDQFGIVTEINDDEVIVTPIDFPIIDFSYTLEGKHLIDTKFSIRKLEQEK